MITHRMYKFCMSKRIIRCFSSSKQLSKSKQKDHWHNLTTRKQATDKALEHFDDFYKSIFRLRWPSVRLGLLSQQKYVAVINNFGDVDSTETLLSNIGAMNVATIFNVWGSNFKSMDIEEGMANTIEEVHKLDRILEQKIRHEDEKELSFLYPDGSGDKLRNSLFSEESQLAKEETGYDRVIDPDLGIDSATLHEFIPATKLKGMEDYLPESEYYAYYKPTSDVPIDIRKEYTFDFPKYLKVYSFDRGVFDTYPPPKRSSTGVSNYYLMNGASLLPVLALNVKPGDTILDMCASPGGKSLLILQTMLPKLLVCNDISRSRVERIHRMLDQYLYDYNSTWKGMLSVQQRNGLEMCEQNFYDKILVDAPCTNDRLSLQDNENNIFKQSRIKERLRLPEVQSQLLTKALRLVKPGGTVVYSTCSLSPVQNDGVVGLSLRRLWQEEKTQFTVMDLSPALKCTSRLFHFADYLNLKFGSVALPFLPSNFGPMYICKMVKNLIMGSDIKPNEHKLEPIIVDGKKLKPCCACPETKKARDTCIIENGEMNCLDLIEAHKACMRKMGFRI